MKRKSDWDGKCYIIKISHFLLQGKCMQMNFRSFKTRLFFWKWNEIVERSILHLLIAVFHKIWLKIEIPFLGQLIASKANKPSMIVVKSSLKEKLFLFSVVNASLLSINFYHSLNGYNDIHCSLMFYVPICIPNFGFCFEQWFIFYHNYVLVGHSQLKKY